MYEEIYDKYNIRDISSPEIYDLTPYGTRIGHPDISKKIVICLGCSCTYGYTLPVEETYPYLLGENLSKDFQVLNMGKINHSLKACIDWYRIFVDYSPYICILQPPDFIRYIYPDLDKNVSVYGHDMGYLFEIQEANGGIIPETLARFDFLIECENLIKKEAKKFENFVSEIVGKGIILIILWYEYYISEATKHYEEMYFKRIKKICESLKIRMTSRYTLDDFKKRNMLTDKVHPNIKGNSEMANELSQIIMVREGMLHKII